MANTASPAKASTLPTPVESALPANPADTGDATRTDSSGPAASVTERGYGGWPTAPTPDYLIPQMGKIPVASTVYFQTVAMTKLYDDISALKLLQLQASLLAGLTQASTQNRALQRTGAEARIEVLQQWIEHFDVPQHLENCETPAQLLATIDEAFVRAGLTALDAEEQHYVVEQWEQMERIIQEVLRKAGRNRMNGFAEFVETIATMAEPHAQALRDVLHDLVHRREGEVPAASSAKAQVDALFKEPVASFEALLARLTNAGITVADFDGSLQPAQPGTARATSRKQEELANLKRRNNEIRQALVNLPNGYNQQRNSFKEQVIGLESKLRQLKGYLGLHADAPPEELKKVQLQVLEFECEIRRQMDMSALATQREEQDHVRLDADLKNNLRLQDEAAADLLSQPDANNPAAATSLQDGLSHFLFGVAFDEARLDPLQAEPDTMDTPAEGVILYHEQGWYGRGLALGNLLHSVALAPGEVTQVAMTHWNHVTRSTDSEATSQGDSTAEVGQQNRSVQEVQDGAVREHTSGGSDADSSAVSEASASSETSAHLSIFSASASITGSSHSRGSSHNVSHVASYTAGDKDVAMQANQAVAAVTQRHAEASRTRRATVVREVAQSEDENLTTRVLANYNHMHALTVMYFEVIEVYQLKTRVVDAERVIFLPFMVSEVKDLIPKFRAVLVDAANAAGLYTLAEAIRHYQAGDGLLADIQAKIRRIAGPPKNVQGTGTVGAEDPGALAAAQARLAAIKADLEAVGKRFDAERDEVKAQIVRLSDDRAAAIDKMRSETPGFLEPFAEQALRVRLQPLDAEVRRLGAQFDALTEAQRQARAQRLSAQYQAERQLQVLELELRRLNDALGLLQDLGKPGHSGPFHDNKLYFNQKVWLSLSPGEVLSLARRRYRFKDELICEQIDPAPVAISGNYVGYRWRCTDAQKTQDFKKQYLEPFTGNPSDDAKSITASIAVPTGGVFGEAVLGQGVSAEKIDLSRFWNWKDSMIPILPTSINALSGAKPTMQNLSAEPGKLDASSAKLSQLQDMPAPQGFGALAQTLQAQVFRDMSGQAMLQSLAQATTAAAQSSEHGAAEIASQNMKAGLDFVKEMGSKAMDAAAAAETGGSSSVLGGMLGNKDGGATSLLGGVLNANEGSANSDLLSKLSGGKGKALANAAEAALKGDGAAETALAAAKDTVAAKKGSAAGAGEHKDDAALPPSELEPSGERPE